MFGLGNCKQLSWKHAIIFYSDAHGGKLGKFKNYFPPSTNEHDFKIDGEWSYRRPDNNKEMRLIRQEGTELPQDGFFAIECLSKNKIIVDGK